MSAVVCWIAGCIVALVVVLCVIAFEAGRTSR